SSRSSSARRASKEFPSCRRSLIRRHSRLQSRRTIQNSRKYWNTWNGSRTSFLASSEWRAASSWSTPRTHRDTTREGAADAPKSGRGSIDHDFAALDAEFMWVLIRHPLGEVDDLVELGIIRFKDIRLRLGADKTGQKGHFLYSFLADHRF